MINRWMGVAILAIAMLLPAGIWLRPVLSGAAGSPHDAEPRPQVNYLAPDFELEGLDGEMIRLSDYRGQVVFINFWATWCPPCLAEMPEMAKLHDNDPDLTIIGVNLVHTESSPAAVSEYMNRHGYEWATALDTNGDIAVQYRALSLPTSLFIDREGVVRARHVGAMTLPMMEDMVRMAGGGG
ncbi:MAG: TlpA disulfide reductase family protein [Thermaerobacterales bacterium]